jgi:hypothetical protein
LSLAEPTTTITDYILAAETFLFSVLLFRANKRFWATAFLFTAIAAVTGGTFHGFRGQLSASAENILWKITVYSIGLSSLFLLLGSSKSIWVVVFAVLQFTVYAIWMATHNDFRYVIYEYGPAMIAVLLLQLIFRQPASPWIIGGILLSFAAAGVQLTGIQFFRYFNHNDLYHMLQMVAMWLLYRGGLLLH